MDWHVSAAWIDVWLSITFPFLKGRAWNSMSTLDIAVDDLTRCTEVSMADSIRLEPEVRRGIQLFN
jgi:hypothetical protein